jgi:hypothetical protein
MISISASSFVMVIRAGGADGVDDEIVLVRKDCAQIESETSVPDVTNDGRNRLAKKTRKILD